MDMNDKIKQILVEKNISPSHFADEIGVQRSSISHILAGRNKPSLDIIQKIIRRYPDLGLDWILDDEETEPTFYTTNRSETRDSLPQNPRNSYSANGSQLNKSPRPVQRYAPSNSEEPTKEFKSVERILIFYTDGTFKSYRPQDD